MASAPLFDNILELIRVTSTDLPPDVRKALLDGTAKERFGSRALLALDTIDTNIKMAADGSAPICQDTGMIKFFVHHPVGYDTLTFRKVAENAVDLAVFRAEQNAGGDRVTGRAQFQLMAAQFETASGWFKAVDGVSLSVEPGEVLAIVGESGSGKSVAMLAVMGLLPWTAKITADKMEFQGRDIQKISAAERRKLIGKDVGTKNLADLKAELMREQIRLARSKNERESGDVIDREVVEAMLVTLGQKLNLLLRLKLEVELGPRGVGMNAAELNVEGGVILQEIREVINANISTFEGEALDRSRDGEAQA